MKGIFKLLFSISIAALSLNANAQRDTEFWFAVPDNSDITYGFTNNFRDHPLVIRLSAFMDDAKVTLSQPANPAFEPIVVIVPAGTTYPIELAGSQADLIGIECRPPGEIVPYGFRISSTEVITAIFENNSAYNPDIYTLKGRNALGFNFVIPAQNEYNQVMTSDAVPNTFLVVASNDDTQVAIVPAKNLSGGYPAGDTIHLSLQKGEVFVAQATGGNANNHLGGSFVMANKEVVVMIADDTMQPSFSSGPDLAADQSIPNEMLGQNYIIAKGYVPNDDGGDEVYIFASDDNTKIYRDGNPAPIATINKGDVHNINLTNNSTYIESDKPVLVYHISGFNQPGAAVIPPIECTGSSIIAFTRPSPDAFHIMTFTQTGNEGNFIIDGSTTLLTASDFEDVPGTGGGWKVARKNMTNQIPSGTGVIMENTSGLFHLGIINGNSTSYRYGFFSNFASLNLGPDQTYCKGDSVVLDAGPGQDSYAWFDYDFPLDTISTEQAIKVGDTGKYFCCATYEMCTPSDTIHLAWHPVPQPDLGNDTTVCPETEVTFYPGDFNAYSWFDGSTDTAFVSDSARIIWVEVFDNNGCHKIDSVEMFNYPTPAPIPIYHD